MGMILCAFGDAAYDHEGHAAQVLNDGTITGTHSAETRPRMIGAVVAACSCGWQGSTYYTTTKLVDEAAEDQALHEWEHTHARPALDHTRRDQVDQLRRLLDYLGRTDTAHIAARRTSDQQRDALDAILRALVRATDIAQQLRDTTTD